MQKPANRLKHVEFENEELSFFMQALTKSFGIWNKYTKLPKKFEIVLAELYAAASSHLLDT